MTLNLRSLALLLFLGTTSAALGLRLQDELQRPPEMPIPARLDGAASARAIEIPNVQKYDPPPIERFAATFDRPLFNAQRRPTASEPVAVGVVEVRALSATLKGILFADTGSFALLTEVGETASVRVSQGELFLGWRLLDINPDNVVFERDEETVTLELIYKAAAQPAPPPRKRRRP